MTENGKRAILSADKVLVRTAKTRSYQNVKNLQVEHECLDGVYETSRSFSTLNKNLAKRVKTAEQIGKNVVYCVDGAAFEDNSVKELLRRPYNRVKIVNGVSKISALADLSNFSGCSYTAFSAYEGEERKKDGAFLAPLIIYDMDDKNLASDIKLMLSDAFGEETKVKYICGERVKVVPVYELDQMTDYDSSSAVAVEKIPFEQKSRFTVNDLQWVIERLRRPDGCPWDRVQTPESIKMNAVEEAYELLDAIDLDDDDKVLEEVGDLLMQVVFHAVMKEERGAFNMGDVVSSVCEKLITRHTHVFGGDSASDEQSALSVWDKNKMKEKGQDTFSSAVSDVPTCFPAFLRAQKICKRLEKGGWKPDENTLKERFSMLLKTAENTDGEERKSAYGKALMCIAWLGRTLGIDGEEALLETVKKASYLYEKYENSVLRDGKDVNALTEDEQEFYLCKAKGE